MKTLILALTLAIFASTTTLPTLAADKPAVEKKDAKPRALPFQGKIDAIDQQAKTIRIGERVFHVTSETRITKDGNPATLSAAKSGDQVGISYRDIDKTLNLVSLRIGAKVDPKAKKEEKK